MANNLKIFGVTYPIDVYMLEWPGDVSPYSA